MTRRVWLSIAAFVITGVLFVITLNQFRESAPPPVEVEPSTPSEIPDFASYTDVNLKKQDFFNFLLPKIHQTNDAELERRRYLLGLNPGNLSNADEAKLYALAKRYRVELRDRSAEQLITALTNKIDVVPASLILAQSANESAWGTSRFARDGNNLFGLWCFTKGCGITPRHRDQGAIHEVERFTSVQAGVDKYVRTLNSHPAYQELRQIRARLRSEQAKLSGSELALGLGQYSERGKEYIEEIQAMIRYNELETFNRSDLYLN